jgi:hypothetical protein
MNYFKKFVFISTHQLIITDNNLKRICIIQFNSTKEIKIYLIVWQLKTQYEDNGEN